MNGHTNRNNAPPPTTTATRRPTSHRVGARPGMTHVTAWAGPARTRSAVTCVTCGAEWPNHEPTCTQIRPVRYAEVTR